MLDRFHRTTRGPDHSGEDQEGNRVEDRLPEAGVEKEMGLGR